LPSVKNVPRFDEENTKKTYTGRELISKLLPPINYKQTTGHFKSAFAPYINYRPDETEVVIKQGQLISGILDAPSVKEDQHLSIFHIIHNEYNAKTALQVDYDVQQLALRFLTKAGFTIGLNDVLISPDAQLETDAVSEKNHQ